ncbi:MAG: SpoIIE family protein phosphatase [Kiritimatiellae bacterium]|nr:SpoIIE family protein phosphatase [Kiritimatiellia bacterium]
MASQKNEPNKILVVDDEKLICLAMKAKLRRIGYTGVAVGTVDEAVALLKEEKGDFRAIITDIMMGDMDGFVFRDIVRGIDSSMPIFFMTALDPEEGSGFLKKIMDDPLSFYLPKSAGSDVMLKRVQRLVASYRIQHFIEEQVEESRKALTLASHVQASMLPMRARMLRGAFYSSWWKPVDVVSGDLYEAMPFGDTAMLYIVGDIQGHGTSSALAMTAAQACLKNLRRQHGEIPMEPHEIANMLQDFFRANLSGVSYMTALIAIHDLQADEVRWITCGAPDLKVVDPASGSMLDSNPCRKGNLPIGLMPDTRYTNDDDITTQLPENALCIAFTDGIFDITRDADGLEQMPASLAGELLTTLTVEARTKGASITIPNKFIQLCSEYGYSHFHDDITALVFGRKAKLDGIYTDTVDLMPKSIDIAARDLGEWARKEGFGEDLVYRLQLVLEEKLMNIHDHGFSERERIREIAGVRAMHSNDTVDLTVWDGGTPTPSIAVAAGDSNVAFEMANRDFSDHGRGRLMVRAMCNGIERIAYGGLNETTYHIPIDAEKGKE